LIDPTKPRSATGGSIEKSADHVIASTEVLSTKSSKSPPGLVPTPQLSAPEVRAVQEVDRPRIRPELVYYRDFEGVVGNAFPNLGLTIHTYTAEPRERAIHIGGNMWREGDEVSDGMILETITENGIEVTYQGYLVLIDVLEMWNADN
jgi:general secretion pathway protein B